MRRFLALVALIVCMVYAGDANAHAIIMSSAPATNETVSGPDVPVQLRYNSRIDLKRSVLTLIGPGDEHHDLPISDKSSRDTLVADLSGLAPGSYRIRWQVLSVDGHITRGDIPFTDVPASAK